MDSPKDTKASEQAPSDLSVPTSPTDARHPHTRYESITQQDDGLSESFQSTDTIRRRPESLPISYGMRNPLYILHITGPPETSSRLKSAITDEGIFQELYSLLRKPLLNRPPSTGIANHHKRASDLFLTLWSHRGCFNRTDPLC